MFNLQSAGSLPVLIEHCPGPCLVSLVFSLDTPDYCSVCLEEGLGTFLSHGKDLLNTGKHVSICHKINEKFCMIILWSEHFSSCNLYIKYLHEYNSFYMITMTCMVWDKGIDCLIKFSSVLMLMRVHPLQQTVKLIQSKDPGMSPIHA